MKKKKKINLPIAVIGIIIAVLIAVCGAFVINLLVTNNQRNTAKQEDNYIGYFDEDVVDNDTDIDNENNAPSSAQSKKEAQESFIKASLKASDKRNKVKNIKSHNKRAKLTEAQKAVKEVKELNNGEWLPPIED